MTTTTYSFTEKKRIRKDFGKRRRCSMFRTCWRSRSTPTASSCSRTAIQMRATTKACTRRSVRYFRFQLFGQRGARIRQLSPGRAAVRRARMPFARHDLRRAAARAGAPGHLRPRVVEQGGQVREGAGSLHGRNSAHDRHRHLHHQRHRARRSFRSCTVRRACSSITTAARRISRASCCIPARVIPYRGSWLDFEFDPKDCAVHAYRPSPQTAGDDAAARARLQRTKQMLDIFFEKNVFHLGKKDGAALELVAERLRGETLQLRPAAGDKIIVEAGKRITARHVRALAEIEDQDAGSAGRIPGRPHHRARHRRPEDRRSAGLGEREINEAHLENVPQGGRRQDRHAVRERSRPRSVRLATRCASIRPRRRSKRWSRSIA